MKKITSTLKSVLVVLLFSLCATTLSAQVKLDPVQIAEIATFFKQPSLQEGKCNAEVLGIVTTAPEFSWTDISTWKNDKGKVWKDYMPGYVSTIFGLEFKNDAPFNGGLSGVSWSTRTDDTPAAMPGVEFLKGTLALSNCNTVVFQLSCSMGVDTVRIACNNPADCYLTIRRCPNLKCIDISNSKGKLRQLTLYSNGLEGPGSFVMENAGNGTTDFCDWVTNIDKNKYTFSTMPDKPLFKLGIDPKNDFRWSSYKEQWSTGLPIGELVGKDSYGIQPDDDIDLSAEYDIRGNMTSYTWRNKEGDIIEPKSKTLDGWFTFGTEHLNKEYCCELRNESYPLLLLNTVWIKVMESTTGGTKETTQDDDIKITYKANEKLLWVSAYEIRNITIYSTAGECVKNINTDNHSIDLADLSTGIYIVKVITTTGEKITKIVL